MANERLFEMLANAYSRPPKAYRALEAAFQGVHDTGQALDEYAARKEKNRQIALGQETLAKVLGTNTPYGLSDTTLEEANLVSKPVEAYASFLKAGREAKSTDRADRLQQGQFQYNGNLTRFNPMTGNYDALTPGGWNTIGTPPSEAPAATQPPPYSGPMLRTPAMQPAPVGAPPAPRPGPGSRVSPTSGYIPSGGSVSPRIPPTVPNEGIDFFTRANTLRGTLENVKATFKPEFVGPFAGRYGSFIDQNISPLANPERSLFRNRVAKSFNNLVYLRTGKQLNDSESLRMADEFIQKNNTPVAFQSALQSMTEEMNSLVDNRRKEYSNQGYRIGDAGMSRTPPSGVNAPSGSSKKTYQKTATNAQGVKIGTNDNWATFEPVK